LKNNESSFLKIALPTRRPKLYPTLSPDIAAKAPKPSRMNILKNPCEAKNPAVNKRLSPGKKKPKNNPDSAKIIKNRPKYPAVFIKEIKPSPENMINIVKN
jgi:hypothetical protein